MTNILINKNTEYKNDHTQNAKIIGSLIAKRTN